MTTFFVSFLAIALLLVMVGVALWLLRRSVTDMGARLSVLWSMLMEARKQSGPLRWRGLSRAIPYLIAVALLLVAFSASAASPSIGVLDDLVGQYKSGSTGWFSTLFGYAQSLFAILATIEVAWAGITWALEKEQLQSWMAALIKKIMTIGFFYALLLNADKWIPAIVDSLVKAGQTAGATGSLSPSSVVALGMDCAGRIMEAISNLGIMDRVAVGLFAEFCALIILFSFLWIACHLAVALIESYIAISANVLFLGFGGARWTSDFVNKVLGYAVATGVKLFMTYLMIGLGMTEASTWANSLATTSIGDNYISTCLSVVCGSVFFAYLATKIPAVAASLLNGAPTLTAGDAAASVGGMAAGGIATAAMATIGGNAMLNAARSGMQRIGGNATSGVPAIAGTATSAGGSIQNASAMGLSSASAGSSTTPLAQTATIASPPLPPGSGGHGTRNSPISSPAQAVAQTPSTSQSTQLIPPSTSPTELQPAIDNSAEDAPATVTPVQPPSLAADSIKQDSKVAERSRSQPIGASAAAANSAFSTSTSDTLKSPTYVPPPVLPNVSTAPENAIGSGNATDSHNQDDKAKDRPRTSMRDEFDNLRRSTPTDQAGGGTVHIKLDHGHE